VIPNHNFRLRAVVFKVDNSTSIYGIHIVVNDNDIVQKLFSIGSLTLTALPSCPVNNVCVGVATLDQFIERVNSGSYVIRSTACAFVFKYTHTKAASSFSSNIQSNS
jgi:hypothetical protein